MRTALQRDDHRLELRVGATADRIHLILAVTNTSETDITASSSMGAWGDLRLIDDAGTQRLDGTMSTAAIEHWTIPPGETLVTTRTTRTPEEVTTTEIPRIEYVSSADEANPDERRYYAPNVDLPADATTTMTTTGHVDLGRCSGSLSLTFTPMYLPDPIDAEHVYTIADDPTPNRTLIDSDSASPESLGFSISYQQDDTE